MINRLPFVLLLLLYALKAVCATAIDPSIMTIRMALTAEPPDLNTLTSTDQVSFFILQHTQEGLLTYDANGNLAPAVAEQWDIHDKTARFILRTDAKWNDGSPVTAHDFVFAWQQALNPATASKYASILYPVKNAQAINRGGMPVEKLGIHAIDERTLDIELEQPISHFPQLLTFATYFPVQEKFYKQQGQRYAADADKLLSNGPYVVREWIHGSSIILEKNTYYWNKNAARINRIEIAHITTDSRATFNLFRDGQIILAGLDADTIADALTQRMNIRQFAEGALVFLEFNHAHNTVMGNLNFRRALQSTIDVNEIVNQVIGLPGVYPAYSLFPRWLRGKTQPFYREYPPLITQLDNTTAHNYLQQAKEELKLQEFPPVRLLVSDQPSSVKLAEYLQAQLEEKLGLTVHLDKQIFKQRLAKMSAGDFDMVLSSWGPDYNDALTFGDLFISTNDNNHGHYSNAAYDQLINVATHSLKTSDRMQAFAGLQRMVNDDVIIVPLFERGSVYVQNPAVKGVVRRIFGGDPDFRYAWIEE